MIKFHPIYPIEGLPSSFRLLFVGAGGSQEAASCEWEMESHVVLVRLHFDKCPIHSTSTNGLIKHIGDIPNIPQPVEPFPCSFLIVTAFNLQPKLYDSLLDRLAYAPGATDVDLGSLLPQLNKPVFVLHHHVINMLATLTFLWIPAKRPEDFDGSLTLPLIKLRAVDVVLVRRAAAEEQHGGGEFAVARGELHGALLDETAEGSEATAGSDVDGRGCLGGGGHAERGVGGADCDMESIFLEK